MRFDARHSLAFYLVIDDRLDHGDEYTVGVLIGTADAGVAGTIARISGRSIKKHESKDKG